MIVADDVTLFARKKDLLEVELGQRSRGKESNECVNSKDIVHVSEWNASRKCVECAQLPKVTDLKYMGSTPHNDGDMNAVAALITLSV